MTLSIEAVDPNDGATYDAFYDVYLAAELTDDEASLWMRDEMRAALEPRIARRADAFVGRIGGCVVAAGRLETPMLDNLDFAEVAVHVGLDDRRQGHGAAMLAGLEREAAGRGRTVLQTLVT